MDKWLTRLKPYRLHGAGLGSVLVWSWLLLTDLTSERVTIPWPVILLTFMVLFGGVLLLDAVAVWRKRPSLFEEHDEDPHETL